MALFSEFFEQFLKAVFDFKVEIFGHKHVFA